jgi:hypothetical protein
LGVLNAPGVCTMHSMANMGSWFTHVLV